MSPEDHDRGELEYTERWYKIIMQPMPYITPQQKEWCAANFDPAEWYHLGFTFCFSREEHLTAFRLTWEE